MLNEGQTVGEDLSLVHGYSGYEDQRRCKTRVTGEVDIRRYNTTIMVGVAQLVEPRIVIPVVVGSSPIVHPKFSLVVLVGEVGR